MTKKNVCHICNKPRDGKEIRALAREANPTVAEHELINYTSGLGCECTLADRAIWNELQQIKKLIKDNPRTTIGIGRWRQGEEP